MYYIMYVDLHVINLFKKNYYVKRSTKINQFSIGLDLTILLLPGTLVIIAL